MRFRDEDDDDAWDDDSEADADLRDDDPTVPCPFCRRDIASEKPGLVPAPDDVIHLKIELTLAAAATFLAARPFVDAQWDSRATLISDVPEWREWQPSTVKKSRCSQIAFPQGEALDVLIDEDHPDKTIVYLVWFET
jgi:hypothetical protein